MRPSIRTLRLSPPGEPRDWQSEGAATLRQPRMNVTIHHVVWEQDGKRLYDQPLICEPVGTIGIIVDKPTGSIGLIAAQRPLARDEAKYAAALPNLDPANLGRIVWEAPRGLPIKDETEEQTAQREIGEESGGRVIRLEKLPMRVSLNSTYFPQTVPVWLTEVDMTKPATSDDPMEGIIGNTTFFGIAEYFRLVENGECVDPLVGSAVAYLIWRKPGLLR